MPNPGSKSSGSWTEHRNADFPGISFHRSTSGVADQHSGSYGYAISNLAYGYLQSNDIPVRPNHQYDLYTYARGEINPEDSQGNWIIRARFYNSSGGYISYQNAASGGAGSLNTILRQAQGKYGRKRAGGSPRRGTQPRCASSCTTITTRARQPGTTRG